MDKRLFSRTFEKIPTISHSNNKKYERGNSETLFQTTGDRYFHVDLSKVIDSGLLTNLLRDLLSSDLTDNDLSKAARKVRNLLSFSKMVEPNAHMRQLLYEASLVLSSILLLQKKVAESIDMLQSAKDYLGSNESVTPSSSVQELIDRLVERALA